MDKKTKALIKKKTEIYHDEMVEELALILLSYIDMTWAECLNISNGVINAGYRIPRQFQPKED
jgi:hypothetical protein